MSYNPRCDSIVRKWLDTIVKDKTKITDEEIDFIIKKQVSRDELKKCIDFFKINGEPEINLPIEPYKIQNSNEWNAAREGLRKTTLKEDEKEAKKAIEAIEESVDDVSDLFPELEVIFIGKHSFDNKQIIENFGPIDGFLEQHLVALLKKVFQNKHPITRSHGLPKIPSKENDKKLLLKALYNYFNNLRGEIIKNRKQQGNSMALRESIGHLDEIKMLIEHFEQDKAKFPYHQFRDYMNNADYYSNEGDMHEQLVKLKRRKHSEDHVKNLLRQFAKIYLLNEGKGIITLSGPGVTREDFEKFRATVDNIPPVISSLIDLLEGKTKELEDSGEEVSYSSLMEVIKRLDSEFTTIRDGVTPEAQAFASVQKGGDKTKESEEALVKLVNKIFEDYKVLKDREKEKITTTQGELASIEATTRELTELRNKLKQAETISEGLDPNTILELDKELTKTKSLLAIAQPQLETLIRENQELKANYDKVLADGKGWVAAYDALKTEIATLKAEHERQDEFSNKLSESAITNAKRTLEEKHKKLISQMESELQQYKGDGSECAVAYGKLSDEIRALQYTHERQEKLSNEIAMGAIRDTEAKYEKKISELEPYKKDSEECAVAYGKLSDELGRFKTKKKERTEARKMPQNTAEPIGSLFGNNTNSFTNTTKEAEVAAAQAAKREAEAAAAAAEAARREAEATAAAEAAQAAAIREKRKAAEEEQNALLKSASVGSLFGNTNSDFENTTAPITKPKELLNAYILFGFLDEKNSNGNPPKFDNIRKYYTRKSGNANTNLMKLDFNDIASMINQINSVMAEHKDDPKYSAAKTLIINDLQITQKEIDSAKGILEATEKAYENGPKLSTNNDDFFGSTPTQSEPKTTEKAEIGTSYRTNNGLGVMKRRVGGARKLLDYSMKVADNRLNDFLTQDPLPFASLITDFEKSSNLSIIRETNEKYILQEFILYQLKTYFKDEKMKEFFYQFNNLFEKINDIVRDNDIALFDILCIEDLIDLLY